MTRVLALIDLVGYKFRGAVAERYSLFFCVCINPFVLLIYLALIYYTAVF